MARINRFGVSFLSIENREESLNEELMAKKSLGMTYIRSKEGYVISFDKLAREKAHVDSASAMASNLDVVGKMYMIDIPDITLPEVIAPDTNLIPEDGITIVVENYRNLFISLDAEGIDTDKDSIINENKPTISCTIERRSMDNKQEDEYIVDHMPLDEFNSHVWDLKKFNGKSNVRITNLQIHPNEKITDENMIYVLYSVIFVGKRR